MIDKEGRTIEYLRISITDRCNFRCKYCMPEAGVTPVSHEEILRYDEIIRLAKLFNRLGITRVKLTGGEPLVRKGIASLISDLKEKAGINEVTLTTNGYYLEEVLDDPNFRKLDAINVSIDTLDKDKFKEITRVDGLDKVLMGIDKAIELGVKVKINTVSLKEYNYDEITALALLARDKDISVRFIEIMPIGLGKDSTGYLENEVLDILESKFGKAKEIKGTLGNGPAKYYTFDNFIGKVGFISSISHSFCSTCNRVRLTSEGFLKPCLYSSKGLDLRELLRNGTEDEDILLAIKEEIYMKPISNKVLADETRVMSKIGG